MASFLMAIVFSLSLSSTATADLTEINAPDPQTQPSCSNSDFFLACEIHEMNSKLAGLELLSETTSRELNSRSVHIENCEKKIEELGHTINHLESQLATLKDEPDYEELIKQLEQQVRELEADVRRNDLNLRQLKVKAKDDKELVESLSSQVETPSKNESKVKKKILKKNSVQKSKLRHKTPMAKIVPELWFHVQKLEQACEVIERRTGELRRSLRNQRCSFYKFINKVPGRHYQNLVVIYTSKALNQLRRLYSAVKKYHHQLQGFVKQEMERNESTAVLAGEELVFLLVSVVFVFPVILALRWLISLFSLASSVVVSLFTLALNLLSLVPFLASAVVVFSIMFALR